VRVIPAPRFEHRHRLAGIRVPIQGVRTPPRGASARLSPLRLEGQMIVFVGRREFSALIGGAAAARLFGARGQPAMPKWSSCPRLEARRANASTMGFR
jgi:hypothetical protein